MTTPGEKLAATLIVLAATPCLPFVALYHLIRDFGLLLRFWWNTMKGEEW